jgi:hypothetical protein
MCREPDFLVRWIFMNDFGTVQLRIVNMNLLFPSPRWDKLITDWDENAIDEVSGAKFSPFGGAERPENLCGSTQRFCSFCCS